MDDYDQLMAALCIVVPSLQDRTFASSETVISEVAKLADTANKVKAELEEDTGVIRLLRRQRDEADSELSRIENLIDSSHTMTKRELVRKIKLVLEDEDTD